MKIYRCVVSMTCDFFSIVLTSFQTMCTTRMDVNRLDIDGYYRYCICFHIFYWIWIQIPIALGTNMHMDCFGYEYE